MAIILATLAAGPASQAAVEYQRLKSFGYPDLAGAPASGPLIEGRDGALYGATRSSGSGLNTFGIVFAVNPDGSHYRILYRFHGPCADGANPSGGLLEGSDGALYGTTFGLEYVNVCCNTNPGTVFKLNKDGTGFTTLHSFSDLDGRNLAAGLIEGSDGALYGSASEGGSYDSGTIFKLNKDGSGFNILHTFSSAGFEGRNPRATLMRGTDGALYGTTDNEGSKIGVIFKLNEDGSGYEVLHPFSNQSSPLFPLIEGRDGVLYGTTMRGGSAYSGTVFKVNKDGSGFDVLHNFGISGDVIYPSGPLLQASDGTLYGTTAAAAVGDRSSVFKLNNDGSGYTILLAFDYLAPSPQFGLMAGRDGALYGAAWRGNYDDPGVIFKLNKDGSAYRVLHTFGGTGGDGFWPGVGLIEATDGALYGVSPGGGLGPATVFKLNQDGNGYEILHRFNNLYDPTYLFYRRPAEGRDGALYGNAGGLLFKLNKDGSGYRGLRGLYWTAGLTAGSDGLLYGTAAQLGIVFRTSADGSNYTVLHAFSDSWYPNADVIEGSDGALYGTTLGNVFTAISNSFGTVFKLNKDGSGYSILHSFSGTSVDGHFPYADLFEGSDGALYGTTSFGGNSNAGTIFRLNKDGSEYSTLHHFTNDPIAGYAQHGGLVEGREGALYGTIAGGASPNVGKVFKIKKDGSGYSAVYSFSTCSGDGQNPNAPLVKGSDGALYGTTRYGGDLGFGTVFRLLVNYPPSAVARVSPVISFSPDTTNGFVISLNNSDAVVYFDASQSSDPDNDPIQFLWLEQGRPTAFGSSVTASNALSVGSHTIVLVASDGMEATTNRTVVQIVTAGQAVQKLVQVLNDSTLSDDQTDPLVAALNAASDSLDRGNPLAAVNQLRSFRKKVRAQLGSENLLLANALIEDAQKIIDSFAGTGR